MMRTIIVGLMLMTSFINCFLFICKWWDTDIDTAWQTFEDHVTNCLEKE